MDQNGSEAIRHINFDARRVSKSILNEILCGIAYKLNQMPPAPYRITKIKMMPRMEAKMSGLKLDKGPVPLNEPSSMTSLIVWNISKALEIEPGLDLKYSIRAAEQCLDSATHNLNNLGVERPEQQHLICALLAWQQIGHSDADSLHRFIQSKKIDKSCVNKRASKPNTCHKHHKNSIHESLKSTNVSRDPAAWKVPPAVRSFGSYISGPVVKLPVETKVIMRIENEPPHQCCKHKKAQKETQKGSQKESESTMEKIDAACSLDSQCAEKLESLGSATNELRSRTCELARREAERVELLERAEAAWRDLEMGYQRRLALAEEKEDDIVKQIEKCIADRAECKKQCSSLTNSMEKVEAAVAKAREELTSVEKQVCGLASTRLQLSEEAAKGEACLTEQLCKVAQFDRDLKFKEEQARRKLEQTQNEADSARALTCEAERAMRAELAGLREQITQVSKELIQEDAANVKIKAENENLRKEKSELIEDLNGCKEICDKKMQGQLDELMKKKEKVLQLQDRALECRCKMPVDQTVQVKRTPSLAAICQCSPEDHFLESCSCTSLRGRMLSNLLSDLFGGLQHELSGCGLQMSCQLLKCLEDSHNWDRASAIKTNLRNFFSKLLKSELDIAIATSIENYHAKWVGATCADVAKMTPTLDDELTEGWQERAIEKRALQRATQLAENLFQERCEQLEQRTKELIESGPPPCECNPGGPEAAVFPCIMSPHSPFNPGKLNVKRKAVIENAESQPAFWKQTSQEVTKLKLQIEDLKKESLKKEDLKLMEQNIFKLVTQVSAIENEDRLAKGNSQVCGESINKETNNLRPTKRDKSPKGSNQRNLDSTGKKVLDNKSLQKRCFIYEKPSKQSKKPVHGQSYAVNVCLCGTEKNGKVVQNVQISSSGKSIWKQKPVRDITPEASYVKQSKPININLQPSDLQENNIITPELCSSNYKCFHKMPSNTSIDELLQTLVSWKYDLTNRTKCIDHISSKSSDTALKDTNIEDNDLNNNDSLLIPNNKKLANDSVIHKDIHVKTDKQPVGQPTTTESEYMGTVYLDKSHENTCKCVTNIENNKNSNQENYEGGHEYTPFQFIETKTCECRIHQELIKDHKRSQTEELQKIEVHSNQCQVVQSKDCSEFNSSPKSSSFANNQQEIKPQSDKIHLPQNSELFSNNGEYYINFLGVTLNDITSNKQSRRKFKTVDHSVGENHKGKYVERPEKLQSLLPKSDGIKCECSAKFEEFKSFMDNYLNNKLHQTTHKDEVIDTQCFKNNDNTIGSCDCCNNGNMDNSKDLEVNAFHLLEDHIKVKLEELKSYSCKTQCLPPEEEEKLFSTIMQKVKQVISDSANKMKCGCSGEFTNNGSWNRAYGLLQEYLKIKIQRVQCLCVSNDSKEAILPEILQKVCNLIENDFQRLKDIRQCKNCTETSTNGVNRESHDFLSKELPEKDTNTLQVKYNDIEVENLCLFSKSSKQISNNSMVIKENISSQVPLNLGMEAKSCDIMTPYDKNARTTETDYIATDSKSNGAMYNTCDCCYNTDKVDIRKFPEMFGTKEVLVNMYTEQAINTIDLCESPKIGITQEPPRCHVIDSVKNTMKSTPTTKDISGSPHIVDVQAPQAPYIGYTVDCSCDGALGSCFCVKSVVQANNDKINSLWKGYLFNSNNNQDFSYIMNGTQKENTDVVVVNSNLVPDNIHKDKTSAASVHNGDRLTSDAGSLVKNVDEITLKYSLNNVNYHHHGMNTIEECLSSGATSNLSESCPLDWIKCPAPTNSGRSDTDKLTNSIYFPGVPINNDKNSLMSSTATDLETQNPSQICDCDKVPICHVKMLVEHIEKNLIESKCTCDSLISKVCPVHSKKDSVNPTLR